ncbi:MAG: response regulator transcription factor [Actinomycetota bacterium]
MTRIVVVEDHTLVRQSLVKIMTAEPGFEVVAEAGSAEEALQVAKSHRPDLVVMDVGIPGEDGLQVAMKLKKLLPDVRILFLTMHDDDATIRRAIGVGADGFVPKTASTEELLQGLRVVASGGSYLSPGVARRVMDLAGGRSGGVVGRLTDRELEILTLLTQGLRPADVAARLYMSIKTVKNHLTNIYAKMGVESAAQAVAEAYRRGLVSVPPSAPNA